MDFQTKPISRDVIRLFASLLRKNYNIKTIRFPVLEFLERIEEITEGEVSYIVEEDVCFEKNVMAYIEISPNYDEYCIHIRNSVYNNAYEGKHADIGFIMHEICHYFMIGILELRPNPHSYYSTKKFPMYESAEWQAKALCGELMIPYDRCKDKTFNQIYHITKSSQAQVQYFFDNVLEREIEVEF